jgi:hypothetical protein
MRPCSSLAQSDISAKGCMPTLDRGLFPKDLPHSVSPVRSSLNSHVVITLTNHMPEWRLNSVRATGIFSAEGKVHFLTDGD